MARSATKKQIEKQVQEWLDDAQAKADSMTGQDAHRMRVRAGILKSVLKLF